MSDDVARLEGILDAATRELNDWRAPTESHGLPLTIPGRIAALASELVTNLATESELVGVARLISNTQVGALNWVVRNNRNWLLVDEDLVKQLDSALEKYAHP